MKKQTKKLSLKTDQIINLSRSSAQQIAGGTFNPVLTKDCVVVRPPIIKLPTTIFNTSAVETNLPSTN